MFAKAFRDCPNLDWCAQNNRIHLWEVLNPLTGQVYKRGRTSFCCTRYFHLKNIERMRLLRG